MTQQMTAESAVTFERHSSTNANVLHNVAHNGGCQCKPYVDWFTYKRWSAQGMQVQKGERGTRLGTFYTKDETDQQGNTVTRTFPGRSVVFCRCQVQAKGD